MLLQDFAENRKSTYGTGEVKQAFYGKKQIQLHPCVIFYRNPEDHHVKFVIMQMSDHLDRHYNVVENLTELALEEVRKVTDVKEVILWSDGCAQQYKVLQLMLLSVKQCFQTSDSYYTSDNFVKQRSAFCPIFR